MLSTPTSLERLRARAGRGRSSRRPGGSSRCDGGSGTRSRDAAPRPVLLPHVVGPLEHVGDPADLALGVRELQLGELHELAARTASRDSDAIALLKLSVAATATGASADVAGIFDDDPMCMHTTVFGVLARREERVPVAGVDARQPEVRRDLAEAHRVHAARRVAPDLGGRELGVPQRDDGQRDRGARRESPHHSSTIQSLYACTHASPRARGPSPRGTSGRRSAGTSGTHSDASTQFIVHVLDARLRVVATGAHLVVGDRRHRHVVAVEADRGHVALVDVDEVLVDPAVGLRSVVVERSARTRRRRCGCIAPMPRRSTRGPASRNRSREPRLPEVRGLDDVVVDADDLRELGHVPSCLWRVGAPGT